MYCSTPVSEGQDTGMAITRQTPWSKNGRFSSVKAPLQPQLYTNFPEHVVHLCLFTTIAGSQSDVLRVWNSYPHTNSGQAF